MTTIKRESTIQPRAANEPQGLQRGFTLLELMIYLAVMLIIGIPIITVMLTVSRASTEGAVLSKIQERNRSALKWILDDYRPSLGGTTVVSAGGKALQFTSNGGFDGSKATAGAVIRFEIRPDVGETLNGLNDNGNGLVDEAVLVRMNLTLGGEVVVAGALNGAASSFAATSSGVTVTLGTFGFTQGTNLVSEIQSTTTTHPLN